MRTEHTIARRRLAAVTVLFCSLCDKNLVVIQTQQTAEATHLAAAALELERRLRGCALSTQWRQPDCATNGTMQVSAAAPPPPRQRERQQLPKQLGAEPTYVCCPTEAGSSR